MGNEKGERRPPENAPFSRAPRRDVPHDRDRPAFTDLDATVLHVGVCAGKITDPQAVRILVHKELAAHRPTHHGSNREDLERRYEPLLEGKASNLAGYCQEIADRYMTLGYDVDGDMTDYPAAARWYEMAGRFSQEAARTEPQGEKHPPEETGKVLQALRRNPSQPPAAWLVRSYQALDKAQTINAGIELGTLTDPEDVHDLIAWQLELVRAKPPSKTADVDPKQQQREALFARLLYGNPKDMVEFCLGEASPQRSGPHRNDEAVAHWYAMAARFARQAERERQARLRGTIAEDPDTDESSGT